MCESKISQPTRRRKYVGTFDLFFKPNFEVHESWVLKDESGVKIEKFVTTSKYHGEINYIKWGRTRLDRKTLELTYRGFRGKIWKRDCSKFNTEEEMDNLLNKYYQKTKTIIKRMKKDNKI